MKREKYLVRRGLMLQGILIIVSLIFMHLCAQRGRLPGR